MKRSPLPRKTPLKRSGVLMKGGVAMPNVLAPKVHSSAPKPPASSGLKRAALVAGKSKRLRAYDADFTRASLRVKERSLGLCEVYPFVSARGEEACDVYAGLPIAETCEFRNPAHIHHRKTRKRGGSNSTDNLLFVCRPCHEFIHANPNASGLLGLLLHSEEDESL